MHWVSLGEFFEDGDEIFSVIKAGDFLNGVAPNHRVWIAECGSKHFSYSGRGNKFVLSFHADSHFKRRCSQKCVTALELIENRSNCLVAKSQQCARWWCPNLLIRTLPARCIAGIGRCAYQSWYRTFVIHVCDKGNEARIVFFVFSFNFTLRHLR